MNSNKTNEGDNDNRFVQYKGWWYDLGDTMRAPESMPDTLVNLKPKDTIVATVKTKKQLLIELTADNAVVTATIVGPMSTIDDWPETEARLIAAGWTARSSTFNTSYDEPGNTGRYITKPRLSRVRTGTFKGRTGGEYTFTWNDTSSHGQIVDLKVNGDALELTMFNNCKVQYALQQGVTT